MQESKAPIADYVGPSHTIVYGGRVITYRWRSHAADQWEGWQRRTLDGWEAIRDADLLKELDG